MPPKKKDKGAEKTPAPKAAPTVVASDGKTVNKAAAFLAQIKKEYKGEAQMSLASESSQTYLKRLATGILTLDLETRGGLPAAGITQLIGAKNAGKSYLAWCVAKELQRRKGQNASVLLAMTEMAADRDQARKCGVKIGYSEDEIAKLSKGRAALGKPPFTEPELAVLRETIGTFHEVAGIDGETLYDIIIKAVEQDVYDLIIIDSVGNVMTREEAEDTTVAANHYGGSSKINTKLVHKLTPLLMLRTADGEIRDPWIIGINQVRDAIGDPNKEYKAPGGNAFAHAKFLDIFVRSGKSLGDHVPYDTPEGKKQKFVVTGKEVTWKIEKGKAGMHEGGAGQYQYLYEDNSVNHYVDTLVGGLKTNVIHQSGSWLAVPDPEVPGNFIIREQSRDAFLTAMKNDYLAASAAGVPDQSILRRIYYMALNAAGIDPNYGW